MKKFNTLSFINYFVPHSFKMALQTVGVMFLICLSSYGIEVDNPRETEARLLLEAISRAQQAFYLEYGRFSTSFKELDLPLKNQTLYYNLEVLEGNNTGLAIAIGWANWKIKLIFKSMITICPPTMIYNFRMRSLYC